MLVETVVAVSNLDHGDLPDEEEIVGDEAEEFDEEKDSMASNDDMTLESF